MNKSIRGKNNPNWRGGGSINYCHRIGKRLKQQCSLCKSKNNLIIHHKNQNRKDNRIKNLKMLCRSCHEKLHIKACNFHINAWTNNETKFLKKNYINLLDKEIGNILNRSSVGISHKRKKLGLVKKVTNCQTCGRYYSEKEKHLCNNSGEW